MAGDVESVAFRRATSLAGSRAPDLVAGWSGRWLELVRPLPRVVRRGPASNWPVLIFVFHLAHVCHLPSEEDTNYARWPVDHATSGYSDDQARSPSRSVHYEFARRNTQDIPIG